MRVTTLNDTATQTTERYSLYVTPTKNMGSVQGYGVGTILDAEAVVAAPAPSPGGGVPTPASIAGKPVVGQIVAKSGQVIENVHVTTTSGPCVVLTNVSNVTIRNSEIGPCGSPGNANSHGIVTIGASNVTISSNVIHDVSTGAYITDSSHPVVFEKNYVYNIRGPFPRGAMIQTNGLKGGSGASRITCNISDAMPGTRYGVSHDWHNVEDHINLFETSGSSCARVEIAYNRIRGGHPTSTSGSGINTGDGQVGSGWIWAHHNTITNVRNVGMAITGGQNITLENNRIYQNSATIKANVGMYGHNYSASCMHRRRDAQQPYLDFEQQLPVEGRHLCHHDHRQQPQRHLAECVHVR